MGGRNLGKHKVSGAVGPKKLKNMRKNKGFRILGDQKAKKANEKECSSAPRMKNNRFCNVSAALGPKNNPFYILGDQEGEKHKKNSAFQN